METGFIPMPRGGEKSSNQGNNGGILFPPSLMAGFETKDSSSRDQ